MASTKKGAEDSFDRHVRSITISTRVALALTLASLAVLELAAYGAQKDQLLKGVAVSHEDYVAYRRLSGGEVAAGHGSSAACVEDAHGAAAASDHGTAATGDHGTAADDHGTAAGGDHAAGTVGDHSTAAPEHHATAAAGDHGAADHSTAAPAHHGAAAAGDHSTAAPGDHGTAAAADHGTAAQEDHGTAAAGDHGTAAAGGHGNNTEGHGEAAGGHGNAFHPHQSSAFEPVIFFLVSYLASAISQQISDMLPHKLRLPASVNLYLMGFFLAWLSSDLMSDTELGRAVNQFTKIDPHVIFWVLLPGLLYEDSSAVHWHVFHRVVPNALLLAVPGVIINTVLTGACIKFLFQTVSWNFPHAFLLGSILSATDPVAVVGALHALGAPDKLSSLIAGESLFNDGSAVVLFQLFMRIASGAQSFQFGAAFQFFFQMAVGGPALGLAWSLVVWIWLRRTSNFSIEILVIVVSIYGLFFVSEHPQVQVSGVLAVVVFGLFMASTGKYALAVEREHEHHAVMGFLALLSNEAIFIIAGCVAYRFLNADVLTRDDFFEGILLYFIVHITRGITLYVCWPLMQHSGYGLHYKEAVICVYGGLRGAVGLAMALLVEHNSQLEEAYRVRIAFHTSVIVFGTLMINGTTVPALYNWLQLYGKAQHHEQLLQIALKKAESMSRRRALSLKENWFFHNCHLEFIIPLTENSVTLLQSLTENVDPEHMHDHSRHHAGNRVRLVMQSLVTKLKNESSDERVARKMVNATHMSKEGAGENMFIFCPEDLMQTRTTEESHELELALSKVTMGENRYSCPKAQGRLKKALEGKTEAEAAELAAQQRWKWVHLRIKSAVHEMHAARERNELLQEAIEEQAQETREKKSEEPMTACSGGSSGKAMGPTSSAIETSMIELKDDARSMAEVHQMVINAARASYERMFESRAINVAPFRILFESLDQQEEMLNKTVAEATKHQKEASENSDRSMQSKVDDSVNMANVLGSGWDHIRKTMGKPLFGTVFYWASMLIRPFGSPMTDNWLEGTWWLLKRDAETVIAYVMTMDHLCENLDMLEGLEDEVMKPMEAIAKEVKNEAILGLTKPPYDDAMFMLFEHLLLARLIVRSQMHIIEHFAAHGVLSGEDAEHTLKKHLLPTERALRMFVPDIGHLKALGSERANSYSRSPWQAFLAWFVSTGMSSNEELGDGD